MLVAWEYCFFRVAIVEEVLVGITCGERPGVGRRGFRVSDTRGC
jgi:hypothetical protein